MIEPLYKKGHKIVWIGFLGGVVFRLLGYMANPEGDIFPNWASLIPIFSILSLGFLIVLIWGCVLVLKAKNRSWAWVFLLLLNVIGLIILFMLKDKSIETIPASTDFPKNNEV